MIFCLSKDSPCKKISEVSIVDVMPSWDTTPRLVTSVLVEFPPREDFWLEVAIARATGQDLSPNPSTKTLVAKFYKLISYGRISQRANPFKYNSNDLQLSALGNRDLQGNQFPKTKPLKLVISNA